MYYGYKPIICHLPLLKFITKPLYYTRAYYYHYAYFVTLFTCFFNNLFYYYSTAYSTAYSVLDITNKPAINRPQTFSLRNLSSTRDQRL